MRRGWDAHSYDRVSTVSDPLIEEVLARLQLRGDETVLDAGCGTGRITAWLLERLPHGRVVAVDLDPQMVSLARQRLPAGTTVIESGLLDLSLPERVDVIFSTATFHWVLDQDELFARLATLLRPGGRLVAQCGGAGAVQGVIQAADAVAREPRWQDHLAAFTPNWYFATPAETEQRLTRSGFSETRCWLQSFVFTPAGACLLSGDDDARKLGAVAAGRAAAGVCGAGCPAAWRTADDRESKAEHRCAARLTQCTACPSCAQRSGCSLVVARSYRSRLPAAGEASATCSATCPILASRARTGRDSTSAMSCSATMSSSTPSIGASLPAYSRIPL